MPAFSICNKGGGAVHMGTNVDRKGCAASNGQAVCWKPI